MTSNGASPVSLTKAPRAPKAPSAPVAATPPALKNDGLGLTMLRNTFYYENSQRMLVVFLGQMLMIVALGLALFRLLDFTDSRDYFFPVSKDNSLIIEQPLSKRTLSDDELIAWAEKAVTRTMTFGYYDHLTRMQDSRVYFTREGWASFTKALDDAAIFARIGAVRGEHITGTPQVVVSRIRPGQNAVILRQGVNGFRYYWDVRMLLDISFLDKSRPTRFTWKVTLRATRMMSSESGEGVGISQLVAEKAE